MNHGVLAEEEEEEEEETLFLVLMYAVVCAFALFRV